MLHGICFLSPLIYGGGGGRRPGTDLPPEISTTESLSQARAAYLPVTIQPVNRLPLDLSQAAKSAWFR